jgi:8-oxo-dGTP pyrophosphatase MutT (NUDIX family)
MNKISHDSETLAENKQVITAGAFIHRKFDGVEKLFLAKRASTKKFLPNLFEASGGHIDFGEDIIEGLKREVMEEHGMRISVGDPFSVFTYINEVKKSHSIQVDYFAEFIDPIENIEIHPEDHSEYKWVAETEIPQPGSMSPEAIAIAHKGFALLRGESHNFG